MNWRPGAAALTAAALLLGACGGGDDRDDGRLRVVAAFAPLAEVAERVGGDGVAVTNLTPAGAEPHDLELTTDQVDDLLDADVVLFLGDGFQPAVEEASERTEGERIDLLEGEEGDDPHVWLDPRAMARLVERVRDAMVDADDAGAAGYRRRASAYLDELRTLDADFEAGLADCDRRVIVTAHDAFGRLAERYELEQVAVAGLSPEAEPDPRRLAEIADEVRARGVTTVFTEALVPPEIAETLAREAGVRTALLDPIENFSGPSDDYVSVMRQNLAVLRQALGCR